MLLGRTKLFEDLVNLDLKVLRHFDSTGHVARRLLVQRHQLVSRRAPDAGVGATLVVLITELTDHHLALTLDGRHAESLRQDISDACVVHFTFGSLRFCNGRRLNKRIIVGLPLRVLVDLAALDLDHR